MKVGGITWWSHNYGSILQAYALQEVLKSFDGVEYEIINQYGGNPRSFGNFLSLCKKLGLKEVFRKICRKLHPRLNARDKSIAEFISDRMNLFNGFNEDNIDLANGRYECFICGSDQIWNPTLISPSNRLYWLNFADAGKHKIAYAPSVGVSRFNAEESLVIKKNLSTFSALSCRESSGTRALNEALGKNSCVTVLDPVMLVDRALWDGISGKAVIKQPYLFAYMLRTNKARVKKTEEIARANNLDILTIPRLEKDGLGCSNFGDYRLWSASPAQFISAVRHAGLVVTDSFHCTAFSCLYHKNFLVFPKLGNPQLTRIEDLQNLFGISSRIIEESTSMAAMPRESIDWERFESILRQTKNTSYEFLENALNNALNDA